MCVSLKILQASLFATVTLGSKADIAVSLSDPEALRFCTQLQGCILSIKTSLRKWQKRPNSGS